MPCHKYLRASNFSYTVHFQTSLVYRVLGTACLKLCASCVRTEVSSGSSWRLENMTVSSSKVCYREIFLFVHLIPKEYELVYINKLNKSCASFHTQPWLRARLKRFYWTVDKKKFTIVECLTLWHGRGAIVSCCSFGKLLCQSLCWFNFVNLLSWTSGPSGGVARLLCSNRPQVV
jgi:hypothetical protein